MTAITTVVTNNQATGRIRTAVAQATTGQTDYVAVPTWARYATFFWDVTAVAGTTPILAPQPQIFDPISRDDTAAAVGVLGGLTITCAATTSQSVYILQYGPGVTGIANATAALSATGASYVFVNCVLPPIIGLKTLNDRTTGNETYTYTIDVAWRA